MPSTENEHAAPRKLQMSLLTATGQLLHCVNCYAGQVSVMRAQSNASLQIYQRALAGIPGPERVSITLDDEPFVPAAHTFIGYGEHMFSAPEPVLDTIASWGLDAEQFRDVAMSYEISLSPQTSWQSLSKCEERRVRLLAATCRADKILILNDPFEPLAIRWREPFADMISQFARVRKQIVIVTSLSHRPECWIDNPNINRVQVGDEIQRTIGFGSSPSQAHQMVDQIRQMIRSEALGAPLGEHSAPETAAYRKPDDSAAASGAVFAFLGLIGFSAERFPRTADRLQSILSNPLTSGLAASAVIVGGALLPLNLPIADRQASTEKITLNTELAVPAEQPVMPKQELPAQQPVTAEQPVVPKEPQQVALKIENPPPVEKAAASVLDEYSMSIKRSILASFRQEFSTRDEGNTEESPKPKTLNESSSTNETVELLKLLETASNTGGKDDDSGSSDGSGSATTSIMNDANSVVPGTPEEERRQVIRQKFLEAIEKAQEIRRNQGG